MSTLTNKDLASRVPIALAADSFVRANTAGNVTVGNAAGWGTPSDNPPSSDTWTKSGGTSASFSIVSNTGQVTSATTAGVCFLGSTTYGDTDVLVRVSADHTSDTMGIAFRGTSSTNTYRLRLLSGTTLRFDKNISGTVTTIAGASFTWSASTLYWIRLRAVGQFLYGRAWADGSSEPATWTVTTTDTALTSGQVGIYFNHNAAADKIAFDHLAVTDALSHSDNLVTRVNIGVLQSKDIATRTYVQALSPRDIASRLRVQSQPQNKDIPARARISAQPLRDLFTRLRFSAVSPRDLLSRVRLASQPQQKDTPARIRTDAQSLRDLFTRLRLLVTTSRDIAARVPIALTWDSFTTGGRGGGTTVAAWNPASDGESWSTSGGPPTFGFSGTQGTITGSTVLTVQLLGSASYTDADVLVRFAVLTSADSAGVVLRGTGVNNHYRARYSNGSFALVLTVGGVPTTLATTAFTATSGTLYWIRGRALGAMLLGKIWADGSSEPTSWTLSASDGTLSSGGVGLSAKPNNSVDTISFDSFSALVPVGGIRDLLARARVQAVIARDLLLRARVQALSPRDLLSRARLASQPQQKNLSARSRIAGGSLRNLVARILLTAPSVPVVRDLAARILLAPNLNEGAILFPLPAQAGPAMGGAVLPMTRPAGAGSYAVNGLIFPDQPMVCTAPFVAGSTIPAGAVFSLTWNNPSGAVQATLSDGSVVTLTFAIYPGTMVSGQVRVSSTLSSGGVFTAIFTILVPILLSVRVVQTQFL